MILEVLLVLLVPTLSSLLVFRAVAQMNKATLLILHFRTLHLPLRALHAVLQGTP